MPLIKKIKIETGIIGIWEISEQPKDFPNLQLDNEELTKLNQYKQPKRKIEFLATRALLHELTGQHLIIEYLPDGKPYLKNNSKEISISHSRNVVAIILNNLPVGIDVEEEDREIYKIATKFLSEYELDCIDKSNNKERSLVLYWCAKEAIFKVTPTQNIDFKKQIIIKPFEIFNEGIINAKLKLVAHVENIKLHYIFIKNNVLVWCVDKSSLEDIK